MLNLTFLIFQLRTSCIICLLVPTFLQLFLQEIFIITRTYSNF